MVRIVDLADGFSSATAPVFSGDIAQIEISAANNIAADVTGLLLNSGEIIQAMITYHVYRDTDSITRLDQSGSYNAYHNGTSWQISENFIDGDDAGFELTITSGGQVRYVTTNLAGTGYVGLLNIRAEALEVI